MRRAGALVAGALVAVSLSGCLLDGSLDGFLDSPGTKPSSARTALPGAEIDPPTLYRRVAPAVVTVISEFGAAEEDGEIGLGTGFATGDGSMIVTNAHVVTNELDNHRRANSVNLQLQDGKRVKAEIAGVDPHADIAVLTSKRRVTGRPLKFATAPARIGEPVMALGSPLGETYTMSVGYVTGVDRRISGLAGFRIYDAVQTDAVITMGNSGGPLVNADGRVLGVNGQILSVGGGGEGLGFAIPAALVKRSSTVLATGETVKYAYLGVEGKPLWRGIEDFAEVPAGPGVLVGEVREGSPADRAGLRGGDEEVSAAGSTVALGGDVITAIGGHELAYNEQLGQALDRFRPGQRVTIEFLRDFSEKSVRVTLAERPLLWPDFWDLFLTKRLRGQRGPAFLPKLR
ncbi:MAG: trypsin-like peptidase domain-containing protein [Solirubrobacterales bacterium]